MQERDQSQKEIQELRSHLVKTDEQWQDRISKLKTDHEMKTTKVNYCNTKLEYTGIEFIDHFIFQLQKERDSMVVKYARSEKEVITAQSHRESIEKKMKDLMKERDGLQEKIKHLNSEKTRVCHMLDAKVNVFDGFS